MTAHSLLSDKVNCDWQYRLLKGIEINGSNLHGVQKLTYAGLEIILSCVLFWLPLIHKVTCFLSNGKLNSFTCYFASICVFIEETTVKLWTYDRLYFRYLLYSSPLYAVLSSYLSISALSMNKRAMLSPTAVCRYHRQCPFHASGPVPVRAKSRYQKQHQCVLNVVYCWHGGVHGGPVRGEGRRGGMPGGRQGVNLATAVCSVL